MNPKTPIVLTLIVAAFLPGCATITRGTTQEISVDSTPQGSRVETTDGATYTTPAAIKLKRNISHTLNFEKAGYEPAKLLSRHRSPAAEQLEWPGTSSSGASSEAPSMLDPVRCMILLRPACTSS